MYNTNFKGGKKMSKLSVIDQLDKAAVGAKKVAPKKSNVPVIEISDEKDAARVEALVSQWFKAKMEREDADSTMKLKAADIMKVIEPIREDMCRKQYHTSVKIEGENDNEEATAIWAAKFSEITESDRNALETILGERFGDYFETVYQTDIPESVYEKLQEELGEKGFQKMLSVLNQAQCIKKATKPNTRYVEDFFKDDVFTDEQKLFLKTHARKNAGYLK